MNDSFNCIFDLDLFKLIHMVLLQAKVISAGGGKCLVELEVTEDHVNLIDGLHGGCSATLVDSVSSWALATKIGPQFNHVSLDIHTTYVKNEYVMNNIVKIVFTVI